MECFGASVGLAGAAVHEVSHTGVQKAGELLVGVGLNVSRGAQWKTEQASHAGANAAVAHRS